MSIARFLSIIAVITLCVGLGDANTEEVAVEDCLKKDSISCVQMLVYRKMKTFFNQDNIELIGGLSLVRDPNRVDHGRSLQDADLEGKVMESKDVENRENAMESFVVKKAFSFFEGRNLNLDLSPLVSRVTETARGIAQSIPTEVQEKVTQFFTEAVELNTTSALANYATEAARGKKKILKKILPILLLVKLKVLTLLVLGYFGIALIAKKAILVSIISIAISAFIGIRKLLSQNHGWQPHQSHHEVHEAYPSHGGGGWADGGGYSVGGGSGPGVGGGGFSGGYDASYSNHGEYGSHSSPVAQSLAYGGQKTSGR
uniref:Osiris 7 n=1 Tax=Timema shepardi TaxID=629360 RepID=A0A7R9B8S2_TIMSH|nr:unnamed protein product [Timema shepardi]